MSWRRFLSRARADRRRAEELDAHFDALVDRYMEHGARRDEARRLARLALGNARVKREEIDDMNRLPLIDALLRDTRHAWRLWRRAPGFTITAIATLALVIGGNTAAGSLIDAVLLRPLPYPQPDRLAIVVTDIHGPRGTGQQDAQDGASWETIRDRAATIDAALEAGGDEAVNLVIGDAASTVRQSRVSAGYFHVLGAPRVMGREFTRDEDRPDGPAVAIVSHALWRDRMHGDPAVVGNTLRVRGELYTIVGVMPDTFRGLTPADVWTPARASTRGEGAGSNYRVIARLKDGRAWSDATLELAVLGRSAFAARGRTADGTDVSWSLAPMQEALTGDARLPYLLLAAAMAVVLVVACVNIAALLLARGRGRVREIATRMALGSSRGAVVRQLMVENVMLAAAGGLAGAWLGALGLDAFTRLGADLIPSWAHAAINARVLAGTAFLSLSTSVVFGLLPALQASRLDVRGALGAGGSRGVAGGRDGWMRRGLIVAELALGVVLLVITGLLARTFLNLRAMDPGFDVANVTTASVSLQDARYQTADQIARLFDASVADLRHAPGVVSAAVSLDLPYRRLLNDGFSFAETPDTRGMTNVMYVTPGFFETLRIPLRRGRDFVDADTASAPQVAIVNERFVRSWAPGQSVLGRHVRMEGVDREIVGVAGDVLVRNAGIEFPGREPGRLMTSPLLFVPAAQTSSGYFRVVHTWFQPVWSVRTAGPMNVEPLLQAAIHRADPWLPLQDVRSLSSVQASAMDMERLLTTLIGVIAGLALLLAAIGVHGLVAYDVTARTKELGIRLALGATRARVVGRLALTGLASAVIGVAIGLVGAWIAVRAFDISALLFRVRGHDAATFAAAPLLLLVVAIVASVLPALRVLRLDPATTLRDQ